VNLKHPTVAGKMSTTAAATTPVGVTADLERPLLDIPYKLTRVPDHCQCYAQLLHMYIGSRWLRKSSPAAG
jgi:hypothetical protein